MDTARVHFVASVVRDEYQTHRIPKILSQMASSLNASLSSTDANAAATTGQKFKDHHEELIDNLSECPSNSFVPSLSNPAGPITGNYAPETHATKFCARPEPFRMIPIMKSYQTWRPRRWCDNDYERRSANRTEGGHMFFAAF